VLPYVEQPALNLGSYRLEAFPVLVGAALVVEFQIVMRRAPKRGIDPLTTSALLGWAIGLGILGAHLFDLVAYRPRELLAHPLSLLEPWRGISSFGGMLGGLLGITVVMRRRAMSRADMLRFVDCLLFALPFTLAVGRLGCALQHDHPGVSSTHWLAVAFPDGPRFDLGLLEFFYVTVLAGAFALLDRRRWPDGFYIGLFFAAYGPVRFALDSLRISEARYLDWTPGQYLSLLATAAGAATLWLVLRRPAALSSR
jgi:phosphatidylglycerol:prolipoprotein diacylglycerol transferase